MPNPLEIVAAKTAGKAAAIGAHAKGLTGVFATLSEQHREVSTLLNRTVVADEPGKRQELWTTLRRELLSHERGELAVVYPVIEQRSATRDITLHHSDQAETLEAAIADLDRAGFDSPQWPELIQRLAELLQKHVDDEEGHFFPRAQKALGPEQAKELTGAFLAAKERAMESMR